ncbi:MAG: type II toxin-antitoxin system HigA family antitoxin [Myxococcota bacterium]
MIRIKPIHDEATYEAALTQVESLWGSKLGTPEGDALDILATLIDAYEAKHHPIVAADPIEAVRFYMEQNSLSQGDLGAIIGSQPRASEILARRRALSVEMIRRIAAAWPIPVEVLIQPIKKNARAVRKKRKAKRRVA